MQRGRLHLPPHLDTLCAALDLAEGAVARYYAISPREWSTRFRYDTGSDTEHPSLPFHPGALAQIAELEPASEERSGFYRIVLRDDELLALGEELGLRPVLAYTLGHELVHLVRFASRRVPFDLPSGMVEEEEALVRRLTLEALRGALAGRELAVVEELAGAGAH